MDMKGSKTEINILTAFAGESQARNRYTYYSSVARKEGFRQIAEIFEETANQEREHAKRLFKLLPGGEAEVAASFPSGVIGDTVANLRAAAAGEQHEWTDMYPAFAATARKEGFDEIADIFEAIAIAEKQHDRRFIALADNIEANSVFKKEEPRVWRCLNCGYVHEGSEAIAVCPACNHSQAHFELLAENW